MISKNGKGNIRLIREEDQQEGIWEGGNINDRESEERERLTIDCIPDSPSKGSAAG